MGPLFLTKDCTSGIVQPRTSTTVSPDDCKVVLPLGPVSQGTFRWGDDSILVVMICDMSPYHPFWLSTRNPVPSSMKLDLSRNQIPFCEFDDRFVVLVRKVVCHSHRTLLRKLDECSSVITTRFLSSFRIPFLQRDDSTGVVLNDALRVSLQFVLC